MKKFAVIGLVFSAVFLTGCNDDEVDMKRMELASQERKNQQYLNNQRGIERDKAEIAAASEVEIQRNIQAEITMRAKALMENLGESLDVVVTSIAAVVIAWYFIYMQMVKLRMQAHLETLSMMKEMAENPLVPPENFRTFDHSARSLLGGSIVTKLEPPKDD